MDGFKRDEYYGTEKYQQIKGENNEKLGVLLVDVPEPRMWEYTYVEFDHDRDKFSVEDTALVGIVSQFGYKCTQEEAKKYPQFKWVALEEL